MNGQHRSVRMFTLWLALFYDIVNMYLVRATFLPKGLTIRQALNYEPLSECDFAFVLQGCLLLNCQKLLLVSVPSDFLPCLLLDSVLFLGP